MEKKNYSELLRDPRWQKKRLEILQRDNWTCEDCGENKKELQVHHKYYIYSRKPWDYPDNLLITLCKDCHKRWQKNDYIIHDLPRVLIGDGWSTEELVKLLKYLRKAFFDKELCNFPDNIKNLFIDGEAVY